MRWIICVGLGALLLAGCREDFQQTADKHVRDDIVRGHEKREAIPFFEAKGKFFDIDATTHADREVVLPLLKRLHELAPTEQWAVLRPKKTDWAYAVLIGLPGNAKTVDRMAEAVQEADDKFSGFILQQWGHEWLLIDLIDKEAYEFLKKNNPDIDKQR
jgi:hypothetical protein